MSGLKWVRSPTGHTSTAELGPIGLMAWSGNVTTYAEVDINGDGPTLEWAEAAAEAKLRETYDALREHFDPVPVLRWNFDDETPDGPGWWAELGQWVMAASADAWLIDTGRSQNPNPVVEGKAVGFEANQRAAEAALRALGVAFRVEGA